MSAGFRKPTPPATVESFVEAANALPVRASVKQDVPWANAHPRHTEPFLIRLPEDLHMQLVWLKENLPNTSMQKIALAALRKEVERLIAEHYPEK